MMLKTGTPACVIAFCYLKMEKINTYWSDVVMRKVFLDDLPRKYGIGANKNVLVIDWNKCVGRKVRFVYDDICGELLITEYDTSKYKVNIEYNNNSSWIATNHFSRCEIGRVLMKRTSDFKYKCDDVIETSTGIIKVVSRRKELKERTTRSNEYRKIYTCKCDSCNRYAFEIDEINLSNGKGCPLCSNKKVVKGINDIATTHPYMLKYFVNIDDAYTHSYGSNHKIYAMCQDCKKIRKIPINTLIGDNMPCECSDSISYPNKFIYSVLQQIGISYKKEKSFKWSNGKIYDVVMFKDTVVIENNGEQHYTYTGRGRSLEEEQENDKLKRELALENGVKHYIELDCRKSELEWIKQSVMSSELPSLLNFKESDIDWIKCNEFATKNLVKEVCENWNNDYILSEYSKELGYSSSTVRRWLRTGTTIGWCDFDEEAQFAMKKEITSKNNKRRCSKKVEIFKDGSSIGTYNSLSELENISLDTFGIKLLHSMISRVCNGKKPQYKGYTFKYVEQTDK